MSQINVCYACDNNYARLAGVSIASILKNAQKNDKLSFFILDSNISNKEKENIVKLKAIKDCDIQFIEISDKKIFENLYLPETKGYLSVVAYYRFLMSSLFSNIDKILYLDCDVIVTCSLSELYKFDISDKYAAVIEDTASKENQKRLNFADNELYFNSGVLLANLAKWREDDIEKKLFANISDGLDDQDILNIVLKEKLLYVDKTYNYQGKAKKYKDKIPPKIIHFITAYKPWLTGSKQSFNKEYFKALSLTPWNNFYDQYLRQFLLNIHKDRKFIHFCFCGLKTRMRYKKNA